MTLVRWEPFRDLVGIQERLSRLMSESPHWGADDGFGAWMPPVDIFEKGDNLVIRAEMPGVNKDDIEVRVENGVLLLRGEKKQDSEVHERGSYRAERVYGSFSRSFTLPTTVDSSQIEAKYRDGVLEVVLPKAEEAKPKKVTIVAE